MSNPGAVLYLRGVREDEWRRSRLLLRSWGPRRGLATVTASTRRIGAEQGLAVIAAEQEDEPVQVLPQLGDVVCRVADELFQRGAEAGGVAGKPLAEELQ